ncbi:MAG TPA: fibronectin/fibrinogen-binding protein [Clostridiales bacterium UBA8960]|nr:fibronectin/fibrinogen-binding protein [Clostridiales bacterium UBA8960]
MAFDGLMIHQLCDELKPLLVGGRIDKIFQPERDELTIGIRGLKSSFSLFLSVDASMPYFTLTSSKKENPQEPPMFCMLMRKHLTGGRIQSMTQIGFERVVVIEIESKNEFGDLELKKLIIEIMGKHSNLILTREDYTIIDSIKRITPEMSRVRTILPGLKYAFLPTEKIDFEIASSEVVETLINQAPDEKLQKVFYEHIQGFSPMISKWLCQRLNVDPSITLNQLTTNDHEQLIMLFDELKAPSPQENKGFVYLDSQVQSKIVYFKPDIDKLLTLKSFATLYSAVDAFYSRSNRAHKMHQRTLSLKKNLAQRIERYTTKLAKQTLELEDAENADELRIIGELITANIYMISKGMSRIGVLDYYVDPPVMRTIELDVRLEPSENAQVFFKKYAKLKKAIIELKRQIAETHEQVVYLENVLTMLTNSEDSKIVDEIREELITQGYVKGRVSKKRPKTSKPSFSTFVSTEGYEILVGKSSLQNDYLTTKLASNKDMWLHTKDIPGSHVIIRTNGQTPDEQVLYEAALIAAYYSKAKNSSNVPVDYTLVKNVSKPSGSKPGMVIYIANKTLFVTPDYDVILKLSKKN